jgi:alpha-1,2-mannosyltransferase
MEIGEQERYGVAARLPASRALPRVVALAGIGFALYGWATFVASFAHDGAIGPRHNAPGVDFMVFYAAARAYAAGNLPLLVDGARFTATLNVVFADRLSGPMPFQPWMYPPTYLLLLLPVALLPFAWAYAAFMGATFASLAAAVAGAVRDRRARLWQTLALLLSPAASAVVLAGQNGFLSAALLIGGFAVLEAHPIAAGVLLGALCFKPQLALMVPVALLAARSWRAAAAAAAMVLCLVALTAALFGVGLWVHWLALMLGPPSDLWRHWAAAARLYTSSVSVCAVLLGAGDGTTKALQLAAILVSAAFTWLAFRTPLARDRRLAVVLAATILAAPNLNTYDMIVLAMAAGLLFARGFVGEFRPGELVVILAAWLAPVYNPPRISPVGFLTPFVILALMTYATIGEGALTWSWAYRRR